MKKSLLSLFLVLVMLVTALPLAVSAAEPTYDYDSLYVQDGLDFQLDFFRSNEFWGENITEGFDLTTKDGINGLLNSNAVVVKTGTGKLANISGKAATTTVTVQDGYFHFVKTASADQINFTGVVPSASNNKSYTSMEMVSEWGAVPGNHRIVLQDIRWLSSGQSFNGIQFNWGGYWPYKTSGVAFNKVWDPENPADYVSKDGYFTGYSNDPLGVNISAMTSLSTMTWNLKVNNPVAGDADYEEGGWAFRHTVSGVVYGTGQADGDKTFAAGRHDESFEMDLYFDGSALDLNGDAEGTTLSGTNDITPANNPWNGGTPYIGYGGTIDVKIYSIRFYTKALSEADMAQNHFADICKWFKLDMGAFDSLSALGKSVMYEAMADFTFEDTLLAVSTAYNEAISIAAVSPYTDGLLTHEGYQLAVEGELGIRAVFSLNVQKLLAAEAAGATVEIGLLAASDGTPASSLQMVELGNGSFSRGPYGKSKVFYTTARGWTESLATDGDKADCYFQKDGRLCLAIGWRDAELDPMTACEFRAYAIVKVGDAAPVVVYFDESSVSFAEGATLYGVTDYYLFEHKNGAALATAPASLKGVIAEVVSEFKLGEKTIADIAAHIFEISAKSYEDTMLGELNDIYNYQCKANKNQMLMKLLRHYDNNGVAVDLYQEITNTIARYSAAHGVDITDRLYEVSDEVGSAESVYLEVNSAKDAIAYKLGENVEFTIAVKSKADASLVSAHHLEYFYTIDGVLGGDGKPVEKKGSVTVSGGRATIVIPKEEIASSTLVTDAAAGTTEGIIIRCYVSAFKDETNKLGGLNMGSGANFAHHGYLGAVIDIENIDLAVSEPADLVQFWQEQMERLYACDPTDTSVTAYTGTVVTQDFSGTSYASLPDITQNNYYHVTLVDKARLTEISNNGHLSAGSIDYMLNNFYIYEVYLKCPGPNAVGAYVTVPKAAADAGTKLPITFSYQGYSASSPGLGSSTSSINVSVSHASYLSGMPADYYTVLRRGACSNYSLGSSASANSSYVNAEDNYTLYMLMRDFQIIRFLCDSEFEGNRPAKNPDGTDAGQMKINAGAITLTGGSMGGYQTVAVSALFGFIPDTETQIKLTRSAPSVPGWGNVAAPSEADRVNNIFGVKYETVNMLYFDSAVLAAYIPVDAELDITRVGLCDYTTPPYSGITIYNRAKCKKKISLHQNSDHSISAEEKLTSGSTVQTAPIYTLSEEAQTGE